MNSSLAQLQQKFLDTMRGGDAAALLSELASGRNASPAVGLSIYRNAYTSRLREALESDHPVLGRYLGDELWAQLCAGFIGAHPSAVRSLRHFGASLPSYLRGVEPFSANPELAEIAELERLLLDCFDAGDAERATWPSLLAMPEAGWPGLRLRFHPSLRQHRVQWNSVEIWRALKHEETPDRAAATDGHWLLWRDPEQITRFRSVDAEERASLQHFLQGGDFSGVCEQLQRGHRAQNVPAIALQVLDRWCSEGLIAGWLTSDE